MKERKLDPEKVTNWDVVEKFVSGGEGPPPTGSSETGAPSAPATEAPASRSTEAPAAETQRKTRSRPAAEDKMRATFDIPRDLHFALKEEAMRRSTTRGRFVSMRELVEEMLRERLEFG